MESERLAKTARGTAAGKLEEYLHLGRRLYQESSERGVGAASFSVGSKPQAADMLDLNLSSESVFTDSAPLLEKFHVVVFVDEAQNTPVTDTTRGVMDCRHSPPMNMPLIAAFFGLSDTWLVLLECSLSRFAANRVVNLEPLSIEDAADSFQRLLDTYYCRTKEEQAFWITPLAKESFNDFLIKALHAGLLAPIANLPHHYQFPIPSVGDDL